MAHIRLHVHLPCVGAGGEADEGVKCWHDKRKARPPQISRRFNDHVALLPLKDRLVLFFDGTARPPYPCDNRERSFVLQSGLLSESIERVTTGWAWHPERGPPHICALATPPSSLSYTRGTTFTFLGDFNNVDQRHKHDPTRANSVKRNSSPLPKVLPA